MRKLRILYFSPSQLWPMNTGARLRNFHLSNSLGAKCSVTLLQISQPGDTTAEPTGTNFERILTVEKERSYTPGKILRGMIGPVPLTVLNYSAARVAVSLREVLRTGDYDAVQLVSIHLFGYMSEIRSSPGRPKILMDWHNIESELMCRYAIAEKNRAKRFVARRTAKLLAGSEMAALRECDAHTVVSEREKEKLLILSPSAEIHVVPNGVDTAAYSVRAERSPDVGRLSLLFVGSMDYHANAEAVTWFVRDGWPQISQEFPAMDFTIVGRDPSSAVEALASERIKVTGTVDDVRPYYENAFAMIVPLRVGGGTRLKILEAMAAGVPVISTRLGAEGLDVTDGKQILLADTIEEMGSAIRLLNKSEALRRSLSEAARVLVRERYDWSASAAILESVYKTLCK